MKRTITWSFNSRRADIDLIRILHEVAPDCRVLEVRFDDHRLVAVRGDAFARAESAGHRPDSGVHAWVYWLPRVSLAGGFARSGSSGSAHVDGHEWMLVAGPTADVPTLESVEAALGAADAQIAELVRVEVRTG